MMNKYQEAKKKPILKTEIVPLYGMMADSHRMDSYKVKTYCCPRCNKVLYKKWLDKSSGTKFNYCHRCGQALDWGCM